jgi:hypothetical protein
MRERASHAVARLEEVRAKAARGLAPAAEVLVSQDLWSALRQYEADVVILATSGFNLSDDDIPPETLVVDVTSPSALPGWRDSEDRTLIRAGAGLIPWGLLPMGFRLADGTIVRDLGDGAGILPGCAIEALVRASMSFGDAAIGAELDDSRTHERMALAFRELGIEPEPPARGGRKLTWEELRQRVGGRILKRKLGGLFV